MIGLAVGVLGLAGVLASAARAFTFRSAPGSPYVVGGTPDSVAVGDFNRDGLADFAVGSTVSSPAFGGRAVVSVLMADRSGGFRFASGSSHAAPIGLGEGEVSLAAGDFNGDRKLDLAATDDADVWLLLGSGDGTFTPAPGSPIADPHDPLQVVVGDFNGDGKPDLAVLNEDDTVSVLLGNGDGTFTPAPGSPISLGAGRPGSIVVGDFTGNGDLDLAVSNQTQGTVSVLLGNGNGAFTPAPGSPVAVGGTPAAIAVGDFTAHGKPDLAVDDAPAHSLSVLLGNGDGTFTPAPGPPIALSGSYLDGVVTGDFNSDGRQDLAFAASSVKTSGLYLLLGDGNGGFQLAPGSPFSERQPPLAPSPEVLASGTFDGRAGVILTPATCCSIDAGDVSVLLAPLRSDPPTAALTVSPNPVLAGKPVKLDASASSDPLDRKIVEYRWDLGGRRFGHDTGTNPSITRVFPSPGRFRVRVRIRNAARQTAIATAELVVRAPPRDAVVAGYVQLCGGPAPGRCFVSTIGECGAPQGCVTSDRVAAIDVLGRRVAVQRLDHGRFRFHLAPGRYTIRLLGDGKHVHGRVLQHRHVTARAHRVATVGFLFDIP